MSITNGYVDLAAFKIRCTLPAGGAHDDDAERAVEAASRMIDEYCNRRFYADSTVSARYYTADNPYVLWVDDLQTTTGLVVKSDENWDGTFETTWTLDSRTGPYGFMAQPANWSAKGLPITRLKAVAGSWPTTVSSVEVTGKWGWANVPKMIVEACLMLAVRYYMRKDTPFGITGSAETGIVTLPRQDPDVAALLAPWRRMT